MAAPSCPEAAGLTHGPAPESLYAAPDTVAAIARASGVMLLIGGYDGSGNFGDVAQLDATLELLEPLGEELLILPVLERSRLDDHAEVIPRMLYPPAHPLFLGPAGAEDGLVAIQPPRQLDYAACFLYGGGYLNRFWGRRKLDMLAAAENLVAAADRVRRVGSGLQAERDWLAGLGVADREALARFELLGGRDPSSEQALTEFLSPAATFASGDDAVGALARAEAPPGPAAGGRLHVNLHFGEHDFVTGEPSALLDFFVGFLDRLGREAGGPVSARPLIAYLDRHVDERPGIERLTAACEAIGVEVDEPLVLAPAVIGEASAEIARGALTLSCSYHVALASLMSGVPTAGIRENGYYDQKFGGLRDAFGLPEEFALDSNREAGECAAGVAAFVLDAGRAAALRESLQTGAQELRRRRRDAEAKLLGRLDPEGPSHAITELHSAPGELSFTAAIDGDAYDLWIRSETAVTPPADAALSACLLPAMRSGGSLTMNEPVSPRVLRTQREYQAIQAAWSLDWDLGQAPLREVEVQVEAPARPAPAGDGRVAAFFSGGVDSWATVLANPEVTDLIFVHGLDLVPSVPQHARLGEEVERRLREAAAKLGLELHVVKTNLRQMSDPLIRWEAYNPSAMIAVALFFEPLFERVLIASDADHETQVPLGTSRMVDQLWSSERLEIVDDGGRLNREQRIELIADHPVAQETLRVCWENPGGAYNCGRCRKCMLTTIPLEALGVREKFTSFPAEFDLDRIGEFRINSPISLILWEDVLETTRRAKRPDLEAVVEALVQEGKRGFGLPPTYRGRRATGGRGLLGALREADRRSTGAEQDAEAAQTQLEAVLASRSWRLTAPLRRLGAALRRN